MISVKKEIISVLSNLSKELGLKDVGFLVEKPENESFGDYSSNIALTLFGKVSKGEKVSKASNGDLKFKTPMKLAEEIVKKLNSSKLKLTNIDKAEAVKPGFINFYLSQNYLTASMIRIIEAPEEYGRSKKLKNKKIMIEFTDPNPFKEFHIGHLYSNAVGESISRLLGALGANVKRANYQGDVGMHIAKSLYTILQISNLKSQISNLEKKSAKVRAEFLGKCYAVGARAYEVSENAKREIEKLNKKIYDKDPSVVALYEKGRQWSLEYFEEIYKRLGTKFDFYYFESEVGIDGLKLVKEFLEKGPPASLDAKHLRAGVFEESQGAVIFPGEKYGLHNRVFINSLGLPTYEAKELGLAIRKYHDFNYDKSIVVTGNEIIGYFRVLLAALGKINPDLAAKTKHLPHGMVRLPTGKMSSREGNVLTGEWLLDETKSLLKSKYSEMTDDTLEKVAIGSVKYALLKGSIGHDIEFNFEESINIQGNSGPYLQYTYVRTQSVLSKAKMKISFARSHLAKLEGEEVSLMRTLSRFPDVVEEAGEKFAPNLLCNYLFDLAQKFNLFYQKHKILESQQKDFRLALTNAVGQVIKNGLFLLGIQSPENM